MRNNQFLLYLLIDAANSFNTPVLQFSSFPQLFGGATCVMVTVKWTLLHMLKQPLGSTEVGSYDSET
jgi:hypothetical protein